MSWTVARSVPTYVIVDEQGRILARHSGLVFLESLLRETVEGQPAPRGSLRSARSRAGTPT